MLLKEIWALRTPLCIKDQVLLFSSPLFWCKLLLGWNHLLFLSLYWSTKAFPHSAPLILPPRRPTPLGILQVLMSLQACRTAKCTYQNRKWLKKKIQLQLSHFWGGEGALSEIFFVKSKLLPECTEISYPILAWLELFRKPPTKHHTSILMQSQQQLRLLLQRQKHSSQV